MNCAEINNSLIPALGNKVTYIGCFTIDALQQIRLDDYPSDRPIVLVSNILPSYSSKVMGHFFSLLLDKKNSLSFFFDSYGKKPENYGINLKKFFKLNKIKYLYRLSGRTQSDFSLTCGLYVMMFIHKASLVGLERALYFFKKNFSEKSLFINDRLVIAYARENFKMLPPCEKTFCLSRQGYLCASLCEEGHL